MPVFKYEIKFEHSNYMTIYMACSKSSDYDVKTDCFLKECEINTITQLTKNQEERWLLFESPSKFTSYHIKKIEESISQVGYSINKKKSTNVKKFIFDNYGHSVTFTNDKLALEIELKSYEFAGFEVFIKILPKHRHYQILKTHGASLTKKIGKCLVSGYDDDSILLPDINSVIIKILDSTKKFM